MDDFEFFGRPGGYHFLWLPDVGRLGLLIQLSAEDSHRGQEAARGWTPQEFVFGLYPDRYPSTQPWLVFVAFEAGVLHSLIIQTR